MPQVTPGYVFDDGETITEAKLNDLGEPVVEFTQEDYDALAEALGETNSGINWLQNPDFRTWSNGTTLSLPSGQWVELADGWEAEGNYTDGVGGGSGASPAPTTYITHTRADDAAHDHVIYCASFAGETNGSSVRYGQRLSAQVAAAMLESGAMLTVELENKTGATQTVRAYFESCSSFENYASTIPRWEAVLGTVANNERKTFTQAIDLSGVVSHTRKGGRIFVKMPGLTGTSKSWLFYYAKLEPGTTASPRRIERDAVRSAGAASAAGGFEFLRNGDFTEWVAPSVTCAEDKDNFGPAGWVIVPADGNTLVAERHLSSPDTKTQESVRLTGGAGVGVVDFGQDIPMRVAAELRTEVVFAISIYNGTALPFTPEFVLDTCDAENTTERTNRIAQPLSLCAAGAWTRVSWAFDGSTQTNMAFGARVAIRIPTTFLDAGTKTVRFAQGSLRFGTTADDYVAEPQRAPLANTRATAADVRGLRITRSSDTEISVECAAAVAEHGDGGLVTIRNLSTTLDISTVGLDGLDLGTATLGKWYHIYLVSDDRGGVGALMHREDDADGPLTLPGGCQWRTGVVGAVRLNGAAAVPEFTQVGQWVFFERASVRDAVCGALNTWEQITEADIEQNVPEIALAVRGSVGASSNTNVRMALSPAGSAVGELSIHLANETNTYNGFRAGAVPFEMVLFEPHTLWVKADSTSHKISMTLCAYQIP